METFQARLVRLGLQAADFEESFARSSGPGGQHVNKVSTAVTLRHGPTGLSTTAQDSRSQATNRELARDRLLDLIERTRAEARQAQIDAREKQRRANAPRPRALKRRILESKRRRSTLKQTRRGRAED